MAKKLFRVLGSEAEDKGTFFPLDPNDTLPEPEQVGVYIRALPASVDRRIIRKYGREEQQFVEKIGDRQIGRKLPMRTFSDEELTSLILDKAAYAWVDTRNISIGAESEAGWDRLLRMLNIEKTTMPFEPDGEITLDGRLTETMKRYILSDDMDLARWIIEKAGKVTASAVAREEELGKN